MKKNMGNMEKQTSADLPELREKVVKPVKSRTFTSKNKVICSERNTAGNGNRFLDRNSPSLDGQDFG